MKHYRFIGIRATNTRALNELGRNQKLRLAVLRALDLTRCLFDK